MFKKLADLFTTIVITVFIGVGLATTTTSISLIIGMTTFAAYVMTSLNQIIHELEKSTFHESDL